MGEKCERCLYNFGDAIKRLQGALFSKDIEMVNDFLELTKLSISKLCEENCLSSENCKRIIDRIDEALKIKDIDKKKDLIFELRELVFWLGVDDIAKACQKE